MKTAAKPKKTRPPSKARPSEDERVALAQLEARIAAPNPSGAGGQLRLLDIGIGDFAAKIPRVVIQRLADAEPIDVADAVGRAQAARKTWQDLKATLELRVRLARARALWELEDPAAAGLELAQISASASSGRNALILEAAARDDAQGELRAGWSPKFSLALLRSASGALSNSIEAALSLVDALTGAGEPQAAVLVLGQLVSGWKEWPTLSRARLADRIGRLELSHREPLEALLAASNEPAAK